MKRALQFVSALAVLAGFVWLLSWITKLVFVALTSMDGDTRGATIALVGVISVPLITFTTQLWLSKRTSREQAIQEKRTEFYSDVIELFMDMFGSTLDEHTTGKRGVNAWAMRMQELTPQMILYGSKDFIRAWNMFRKVSTFSESSEGVNDKLLHLMIASIEMMMLAARRDLGHRVRSGDQGDYVAIFINDLDQEKVKLAYRDIKAGNFKR